MAARYRCLAALLLSVQALVGLPSVSSATLPPVGCAGEVATIVGSAGDDRLRGTPGRDVIAGQGGDDVLVGRGGDDLFCGGPGSDELVGGGGDDRLHGGRDRYGSDRGGEFLLGDTLRGGPGDDLLDVGYDAASRRHPHRRPDAVSFASATAGVVVDLSRDPGTAAGEGADTVVLTQAIGVLGSAADDTLTGTRHGDVLVGDGGDDRISGRRGVDRLTADTVAGRSTGDDVVRGGPGPDVISSRAGSDVVVGGGGDDWIEAYGAGPARVRAGAGDDVVTQALSAEPGMVSAGGAGTDVVALDGDRAGSDPDGRAFTIDLRDGTTSWTTAAGASSPAGSTRGVEEYRLLGLLRWVFEGASAADRVWAVSGPLVARTRGGDDWVQGSDRPDTIDTGAGTDTVHAGPGPDDCVHFESGSC